MMLPIVFTFACVQCQFKSPAKICLGYMLFSKVGEVAQLSRRYKAQSEKFSPVRRVIRIILLLRLFQKKYEL